MRYYIINCKGETLGEAGTRAEAEAKMRDIFTDSRIEEDEIEVIPEHQEYGVKRIEVFNGVKTEAMLNVKGFLHPAM